MKALLENRILVASFIAWAIAQLTKTIYELIRYRELKTESSCLFRWYAQFALSACYGPRNRNWSYCWLRFSLFRH